MPPVMRKWYLVRITKLTHEQELSNLLQEEDWHGALDLAHQYQLPTDDVYK